MGGVPEEVARLAEERSRARAAGDYAAADALRARIREAGFEVTDLGVDTTLDKFLAAIEKVQPQVVGMSALLTTTMGQMARNIEAFDKLGLRERLRVMVGGAPLSQEYATRIAADGYGKDAADAVDKAHKLIRKVKSMLQTRT